MSVHAPDRRREGEKYYYYYVVIGEKLLINNITIHNDNYYYNTNFMWVIEMPVEGSFHLPKYNTEVLKCSKGLALPEELQILVTPLNSSIHSPVNTCKR